MSKAALK